MNKPLYAPDQNMVFGIVWYVSQYKTCFKTQYLWDKLIFHSSSRALVDLELTENNSV